MAVTMKLNVAKSLETTSSKSVFLDVPKDGSVRVRFLPAVEGSGGSIFGYVKNHFRLKSEDGEKSITAACNQQHGDGDCFLCDVVEHLNGSDDKAENELVDGRESIKAGNSWYAQVLVATRIDTPEGEPPQFEYSDVKFLRVPKTGATKIGNIMKMQAENGEPFFVDEEHGRDLVVSRVDTGVSFTQYDAMTAGVPSKLDDIKPGWDKKIYSWDKFWDKMDLRTMSNDEQRKCLVWSYPNFDWAGIFEEMGV